MGSSVWNPASFCFLSLLYVPRKWYMKWPSQTAEPCLPSLVKVFSVQEKDQHWASIVLHPLSQAHRSPSTQLLGEIYVLWDPGCWQSLLSHRCSPSSPSFAPQCPSVPIISQSSSIESFSCRTDVIWWDRGKLWELSLESQNAMVLRAETVGKDPIPVSAEPISVGPWASHLSELQCLHLQNQNHASSMGWPGPLLLQVRETQLVTKSIPSVWCCSCYLESSHRSLIIMIPNPFFRQVNSIGL